MELQPGYLLKLPKDEIGRGTFGDMYGALNTLFSGIGIIGLLATIIIQIYLYHHDKNVNKCDKEDEEKQLLYYIWFRLNSILTDIHRAINEGKVIIDNYTKMEDVGFSPIKLKYLDEEIYRKNIKNFEALRRCLKIIFGQIQFLFRIIWQLVSNIHASAEFVVFS